MKKLLILLVLIPNVLFALPATLDDYMSKNPSWNTSDRASLSYITLRCGVLFEQISDFYKNRTELQEDFEISSKNATNFLGSRPIFIKQAALISIALKLKKKHPKKK